MKIYCYNNLHNGDNLFSRPLIKTLLSKGHDVLVGCFLNMAYLFSDFPSLKIAHFNEGKGDLLSLCPQDYFPIDTWLGHSWRKNDFIGINWKNFVELFNEQSPLDKLEYNPDDIPFMDFNIDLSIDVPENTIYIANSNCRGGCSSFIFNLERLSKNFPQYNFLCTQNPEYKNSNVLDYSNKNLIELSKASEKCIAILGKGSAPSDCTIINSNIGKPRAFCGFHGRGLKPCYPHPKDRTEFLNTMDEVIKFIGRI
jgi:hypothetical protein